MTAPHPMQPRPERRPSTPEMLAKAYAAWRAARFNEGAKQ